LPQKLAGRQVALLRFIKTPNIDKFYTDAVRFTNYHVSTTCALSRGALMTGRHTNLNFFKDNSNLSETVHRFYGMITNIDDNFKVLEKKRDALGLTDNTILVFTADNGTARGRDVFNAGLKGGKGSVSRDKQK
jgi:arylsulfatase A-like enzyme